MDEDRHISLETKLYFEDGKFAGTVGDFVEAFLEILLDEGEE